MFNPFVHPTLRRFDRLRAHPTFAMLALVSLLASAGPVAAQSAPAAVSAPMPAAATSTRVNTGAQPQSPSLAASSPAAMPFTPPVYVSVLARYRAMQDIAVAPWPESNALVNRLGGWRAYAREAQTPETSAKPPAANAPGAAPVAAPPAASPSATAPAKAAPTAADPHAGHRSRP